MKPTIGIVANYTYNGAQGFAEGIGAREQEWQCLADDYVHAVITAGGVPLILPLIKEDPREELLQAMLDKVDGVIFTGGNDVNPLHFGERSNGKTGPLLPERDEQELLLMKLAMAKPNLPILGICRGIQLINVYFGGTLIQHIPDTGCPSHSLSMYPRTLVSHYVDVKDGSLLQDITGVRRLGVNSFHHMAVDHCAPALVVTARADDGIVEAVELSENPDNRFFLAVQWHPEMMRGNEDGEKIFQAFVEKCSRSIRIQ